MEVKVGQSFVTVIKKNHPVPNRCWYFALYVSGFCYIHGKTPRGILPVNSYLALQYFWECV